MKLRHRLGRTAAVLILSGMALTAAAGASAQTPAPPSEKFGDWALACREIGKEPAEQQERCVLTQNIVMKQTSKRVLNFSVTRPAADKPFLAAVTAPLGILLQAGLVLTVDDKELVRFPLQICNVNGCHGQFPLSPEVRSALEAGKSGKITIRQPNGRPLAIEFSLNGFTAGMNALVAKG